MGKPPRRPNVARESGSEADVTVVWKPFPGPQTEALRRTEDEIYYGGARGGGKSAVQRAWMARPAVELDDDGRLKYPKYRGLVVRYQYEDLKEFIDSTKELYRKFGAVAKDDPAEFHFPGGPIIYTGYLKGEAWQKYQGWNVHKLGVDEAGQVPEINFMGNRVWPIELLMASVRGSPDGRNQTFLTGNPGNISDRLIKERYVRAKDLKGRVIPPFTTILDPASGKTRVFIPAKVTDNPWILENDPAYMARLRAMPEAVRRAWIDGDWDSFEGSYFSDFRPNGPIGTSEPKWARHILRKEQVKMAPWWWRWASLDWGYGHYAPAYKFCQNPNGQVITYGELVRQKTHSYKLGVDLAKWLLPDLAGLPEKNLLLYVSPDAIDHHRDEGHTIAENIQLGMQTVLGKGGAWIATYDEDEKELKKKDPVAALERMRRRQREMQTEYSITIVRANNARIAGWNYMRDLMRFMPIERPQPDMAYVQALMQSHHSETLIQQYLSNFSDKEEVLPGVVMTDECKYLAEWIPTALHDPARLEDVLKCEGDDFGDAWRYGLMAHSDNRGAMPKAQYISERIAAVEASMISRGFSLEDPTIMAHAMMRIEGEWTEEQPSTGQGFYLNRAGINGPLGIRKRKAN
jgi:hypothetical protein